MRKTKLKQHLINEVVKTNNVPYAIAEERFNALYDSGILEYLNPLETFSQFIMDKFIADDKFLIGLMSEMINTLPKALIKETLDGMREKFNEVNANA